MICHTPLQSRLAGPLAADLSRRAWLGMEILQPFLAPNCLNLTSNVVLGQRAPA